MSDIKWCIEYLKRYNRIDALPELSDEALFRALQNITMPYDLSEEFYRKQDAVLQEILSRKEVVDGSEFPDGITLYRGDITLLRATPSSMLVTIKCSDVSCRDIIVSTTLSILLPACRSDGI